MLSRRQVLKGLTLAGVSTISFGGYALAEPLLVGVTRYEVSPPAWPAGLSLRLVILADLHICEPWMGLERLRSIVARANALAPDAVLLLGDFECGGKLAMWGHPVSADVWAPVLGGLSAPLGVHAVLGNHDWWQDGEAMRRRAGPTRAGLALEAAGIAVYENDAVPLQKDGSPFWLAGLGDQWAFRAPRGFDRKAEGVDDLAGTLGRCGDEGPVILMVHEPDIFPEVPDRVALTVAGHTHGGQVAFAGYAPVVPSRYGQRYLRGHIIEGARNLVVSAGLGCSALPIRFGAPPEIVVVDVASGHEFA